MAYCQECGSEVAKEDTYCPFCGIALQFLTVESEPESPQIEAAREVAEAVSAKQIGEHSDISMPNTAEDWEVMPVKKSVSAVSNFFNSEIEEVDPTAVTVVERTKKKVETVEEAEAEREESASINEAVEPNVVAETTTSETNFAEQAETVEPEIVAEVSDVQTVEKPKIAQIAERFNEPQIADSQVAAEFDDRNFEEEFEKLIDHPKGEIPAENDSETDAFQEQNVEHAEREDTSSVGNPFEATMAYTPVDVKDLNLSEVEATAVEGEKEIIEETKPAELSEEIAIEEDSPITAGVLVEDEIIEPKVEEVSGEHGFAEISEVEEENEIVEPPETIETEPKIVENESSFESLASILAEPIVTETVAKEQIKERLTTHVGEVVDTGGGKSKLKPLSEGTVLNGRYEIVRKIGGGGMGAVYLASDRNLGGVLRAVKEMVQSHIEEAHQDKAVNDFKRESLLLTSLEHPSIPTIYDYFFDDRENRFYLVMKYISGGDLAGRLRSAPENRLDEKTITEWAIQVADVLDYLHSREPPIVYRDLKPSNVMIDGNSGRVMLIDFGIARWVSAKEEKGVTAVGTMGYAPPELFSGNVEPRSDIYSLGSTMFHLLTGADPQNSPLLIFDFNKNPRPRQINSMLSDQMEQILLRSVEYDADKRFTNAAEMREILINHLDNIRTGKLTFGVSDGISAVGFVGGQMVFCGFCGQKIVSSDMFCPFCGAKQATGQMSASSPIPQSVFNVPSIIAKLHLIGTNELSAITYSLEKDNNLIGRRDPMSNIFPEVDLSKYDPQTKISRRHARLWREGDTFMVEDLGSSNGTILLTAFNEQLRLLPHQPRVIAHGDKIKIGDTTLHFVVG